MLRRHRDDGTPLTPEHGAVIQQGYEQRDRANMAPADGYTERDIDRIAQRESSPAERAGGALLAPGGALLAQAALFSPQAALFSGPPNVY